MQNQTVLIIGTGHLAYRLKTLLTANSYRVIHYTQEEILKNSNSVSLVKNVQIFKQHSDFANLKMIYLIDERDEINLQLIIAFASLFPQVPVTASLFNENIISHLQAQNKLIKILNPAKIAAPFFVNALNKPLDKKNNAGSFVKQNEVKGKRRFSLSQKLAVVFSMLIFFAVFFFHYQENLSWIDSLYFVVVTIATVGYGDINLLNSSDGSKLFGVFLILSSTIFIWMIFSLTINSILKNQLSLSLGRKKYKYKNHIILCGLGRLGYFIAEELIEKNEKVIIIEQNETGRYLNYFRESGACVYAGDATLSKVLEDVNVYKAKALISVINNDAVNIEIGLIARSFNPELKLILRVFDEHITEKIKDFFGIHIALSASDIADEIFYEQMK